MRCRACGRTIAEGCAADCSFRGVFPITPTDPATMGDCLDLGAWLRAAYLRRRSDDWPDLLTAMRSPILSRLILQEAQHPTAGATIKRPEVVRPDPPPVGVSSPVTKPSNVTVTKRDQPRGSPTPQALDFKSLAAGERPDAEDS